MTVEITFWAKKQGYLYKLMVPICKNEKNFKCPVCYVLMKIKVIPEHKGGT
jgi:hypothetical protein